MGRRERAPTCRRGELVSVRICEGRHALRIVRMASHGRFSSYLTTLVGSAPAAIAQFYRRTDPSGTERLQVGRHSEHVRQLQPLRDTMHDGHIAQVILKGAQLLD